MKNKSPRTLKISSRIKKEWVSIVVSVREAVEEHPLLPLVLVLFAMTTWAAVELIIPPARPSSNSSIHSAPSFIQPDKIEEDIRATPALVSPPAFNEVPYSEERHSGDWADSIVPPAWVSNPGESFGRPYSPLGEGFPAPINPERPVEVESISVLIVSRTQGRTVNVDDVGLGGERLGVQTLRTLGRLSLLRDCKQSISVDAVTSQEEYTRTRGRIIGNGGEWLFSLATEANKCETARRRSFPVVSLSTPHIEGLVSALSHDNVNKIPPGIVFSGEHLKEVAVSGPAQDGTVYAWGTSRHRTSSRMAPLPPTPQIIFVARKPRDDDWELIWAVYTDESNAKMGLAGVYDSDKNRMPEGIFVIQLGDEASVVRVAPDEQGSWKIVGRQNLMTF